MKTTDGPSIAHPAVLCEELTPSLYPDGRMRHATTEKPLLEQRADEDTQTEFLARGRASLAAARTGEPLITADQVIQEMRDRLARAQQTLR
ncbi:MAG: hypothetical protein JZU58_16020 [Curvibacter lanceolatus]|jgi:hypothetical protein|uniref:hypothetical protein n=1 Tax=Curvibacter lanceolatus TaxID=86182 RepID=UPI000370446A|nr:hypothetical protein [Curvibacter lanceolatus]MBV5293852.1 hypothetical protein [Curvibacter lanceolatus]